MKRIASAVFASVLVVSPVLSFAQEFEPSLAPSNTSTSSSSTVSSIAPTTAPSSTARSDAPSTGVTTVTPTPGSSGSSSGSSHGSTSAPSTSTRGEPEFTPVDTSSRKDDGPQYMKGRVNQPKQHIDWTLTFGANFYQEHNIVVYADSIYANPARVSLGNGSALNTSPENIPGGKNNQGCQVGGVNIADELRKYTSKPIADYSCSGGAVTFETNAADMYEMVEHSTRTGALNATTDQVIISIGMVDFNLFSTWQGVPANVWNPAQAMVDFQRTLTGHVNRIKQVAPNARITIVSYPSISAPNGALCPIRTNADKDNAGFALDRTFAAYEDRVDYSLWKVAQNTGAQWFDMRKATEGHDMCAPNDRRYISGAIEKTLPFNMTNHLTHDGIRAVGKILADNVLMR